MEETKVSGHLSANQTVETKLNREQVLLSFVFHFMGNPWREEKPTMESIFDKAFDYTKAFEKTCQRLHGGAQ